MLKIDEVITNSSTGRKYTITWASDKISQAEVGFASTPAEGNAFFIKRLLSIKYPLDSSPGSERLKEARRKECDAFFSKYSSLYDSVRKGCGSDGACVPIVDFFREDAFYYTVYPKIDASSLSLAEVAALPVLTKLRLIQRIVQGLQPLHVQGIVHGDLKPDNILVQANKDDWRIRLIDMNDCYRSGEPNDPGLVIGTMDYYSPELHTYNTYEIEDHEDDAEMAHVAKMAGNLTMKSDIFALGIIFHEYLCGSKPPVKEGYESICEAANDHALTIAAGCGPEIDSLLKSMLDKDFKNRPSLVQIGNTLQNIILRSSAVTAPAYSIARLDDGSRQVTITTLNPACSIHYTLDGTVPTKASPRYESPLKFSTYASIKAICINETDGKKSQAVSIIVPASANTMKRKTPTPKATVKDGRFEVATEPDTTYHYTLDGTNPTVRSSKYSGPIDVDYTVTRKVRLVAVREGARYLPSDVVDLNVYPPRLQSPVIHYKAGNVSIDNPNGKGDIYYTLDGSEPSLSSTRYAGPFVIEDTSRFVVNTRCILPGGIASETASISRPSKVLKMK